MQNALAYAKTHENRFIAELEDWLRMPSISTDPAYKPDVEKAAHWLADALTTIGVNHVEVCPTDGHPIVYAEHIVDENLPTVLCYGHYDVQPPDPLDLWNSPPFEPTRRGTDLYARGASDDKGQTYMHIKAIEAYLQTAGQLPINLKLLIEGEEESGSPNLAPFIAAHQGKLAADYVLISDTALFARDVPSITSGLRGLAYVEVTLTGPNRDLHSGVYGGGVENPLNALCRLISNLHDDQHHITIPGFYDNVLDLNDEERAAYRALPFDEAAWKASIGIAAHKTEAGYHILEGCSGRPTLDVNGIWGGYIGEGAKTVLPAQASAKISMRLVPNQTPDEITEKIRAYFEANTPPTMTLTFKNLHGGHPVLVDTKSPAMQAAATAMEAVFGKPPVFTREGGSIPVVADFKRLLGLDTVLMGFGLNSDALHSPNEKFGLDRFAWGIEASIRFMDALAQQSS